MTGVKNTAAVVVTFNGFSFLKRHLDSLLRQSKPFYRILVVDNGSRDHTWMFLKTHHPEVELLSLVRNVGFAGGVNQGIRFLWPDPTIQTFALINNDVHLEHRWHQEARQVLFSEDDIGSCATCLMQHGRTGCIDTAGIEWISPGLADNYLHGQPGPPSGGEPPEIFGACAGAALYRRAFFASVGLFDESLFAYQEDVEIALRGQLAGWKCRLAPRARGCHVGMGSNRLFPLGGTYADFFNARNRLTVLMQCLPATIWRQYGFAMAMTQMRLMIRSLPEGRGLSVAAGILLALCRFPQTQRRRRRVMRGIGDARLSRETLWI